jgi:hypothetical protein
VVWLILLIVVVVIVAAVANEVNKAKIAADQNATFMATRKGWDVYVSPYEQRVIGLNPDGSEIVLGSVHSPRACKSTDLVSVELLKDGASITSTNRGSQLAGAAIGGLALGGVGLLLGGLSGSKTSRNTIQSIAIKVIVDDRAAPVHVIEFLKSPTDKGIDPKSALVRPMIEAADRYHAMLVAAVRKAQPAQVVGPTPAPMLPQPSTADELGRLWELKQAGALTNDEFNAQKSRLLSASTH